MMAQSQNYKLGSRKLQILQFFAEVPQNKDLLCPLPWIVPLQYLFPFSIMFLISVDDGICINITRIMLLIE